MSNSLPYIILITVFCSFAFIFERTENNLTKTKIQYCSIGIFLIFFGLLTKSDNFFFSTVLLFKRVIV